MYMIHVIFNLCELTRKPKEDKKHISLKAADET
jgi:hypothetical protein